MRHGLSLQPTAWRDSTGGSILSHIDLIMGSIPPLWQMPSAGTGAGGPFPARTAAARAVLCAHRGPYT